MRDILKYGITLMLVAAFSAGTLAVVYNATEEKRKKVVEDERQNALLEVLPGAKVFEAVKKGDTILYYVGYKTGLMNQTPTHKVYSKKVVVGYACIAEGEGYSSTIKTMVGVTTDGEIIGLKILSQKETPGLGARIEEVASSKTLKDLFRRGAKKEKKEEKDAEEKPWFQKQFIGKKPEDLYIEKMDAITGATISSEAVIDSVREKIQSVVSGQIVVAKLALLLSSKLDHYRFALKVC